MAICLEEEETRLEEETFVWKKRLSFGGKEVEEEETEEEKIGKPFKLNR